MAAAYAFHLAENQPFLACNKRTGLMATLVFLELSGFIVLNSEGRLYDAMIAIASKQVEKEQSARLLKELSEAGHDEDKLWRLFMGSLSRRSINSWMYVMAMIQNGLIQCAYAWASFNTAAWVAEFR
jgi:hypothetical protein